VAVIFSIMVLISVVGSTIEVSVTSSVIVSRGAVATMVRTTVSGCCVAVTITVCTIGDPAIVLTSVCGATGLVTVSIIV